MISAASSMSPSARENSPRASARHDLKSFQANLKRVGDNGGGFEDMSVTLTGRQRAF
jgi:hypothetical protein